MIKNNEINYDDLSNGTVVNGKWVGRGIFDKLMNVVNENINIQFNDGRITGAEYAEVYMGSIQEVIRESVAFILQKKVVEGNLIEQDINIEAKEFALEKEKAKWAIDEDTLKNNKLLSDIEVEYKTKLYDRELDFKDAQIDKLAKDSDVIEANIALLDRQREGFDDNKHQKLFEAQMNAWALMFSSGILTTKPNIIRDDAVSALYSELTGYAPPPTPPTP